MSNIFEHAYKAFLAPEKSITTLDNNFVDEDVVWHVAHPINTLQGSDTVKSNYFDLLKNSLPDIERKAFI
jgi:hypothetical protein